MTVPLMAANGAAVTTGHSPAEPAEHNSSIRDGDNRVPTEVSAAPIASLCLAATVLIVGNDRGARDLLGLRAGGRRFALQHVDDGLGALARLRSNRFDLIVLNDVLSDLDGFAVCRAIRASPKHASTPLLLLLSRSDVSDIALGFDSGADQCLERPSGRAALARFGAFLRRHMPAEEPCQHLRHIRAGLLTIDLEYRQAWIRGAAVDLTAQQFELLYRLASRPGLVFSRVALLSYLSHRNRGATERTIDSAICRIRRKIAGSDVPAMLLTVWGIGYKFASDGVGTPPLEETVHHGETLT
jgi:two-component system response regulator ResD